MVLTIRAEERVGTRWSVGADVESGHLAPGPCSRQAHFYDTWS